MSNTDTEQDNLNNILSEELIRKISSDKNEPGWMLEKRVEAFSLFENARLPTWGPSLEELDLRNISYYIPPNVDEKKSWAEVPQEIKDTFDKLGIPKAEHEYLGGVGAQYDSGIVYHRIKDSLAKIGVVFENMDTAVQKYPELVQKYFMTDCVPITDHTFTKLHGAVWSGGTFIYIPKGVKVTMPLQAYFRMNAPSAGQFEHTLIIADEGSEVEYIEGCSAPKYTASSLHAGCVEIIVMKNAKVKYISVENWSKNTYNLNTKKALVYEGGEINWVNGNMGSRVTMLYPTSLLLGDNSKSESMGIVFAGNNQHQDTGSKVIHMGKNTSSVIRSKSVSREGGIANYRGLVQVTKKADNAKSFVGCDALILDSKSVSNTWPMSKIQNKNANVTHEATVGKIGDKELF
ncbi:MAG: Fe-S cluster assembly protein SufB, partial [Patescibacteria group bacterium]|nr:Fe-S cluster assembly protein SufB [Patescibacteria group bacterium]